MVIEMRQVDAGRKSDGAAALQCHRYVLSLTVVGIRHAALLLKHY